MDINIRLDDFIARGLLKNFRRPPQIALGREQMRRSCPLANCVFCTENVGYSEENAMVTRERTPKTFSAGSLVRVKKGVTAPNNPDLPLGGWLGTISQVSGTMRLVVWSGATLEAVRAMYRSRGKEEREDIHTMWLSEISLEGDPGEPLCIELGERIGVEH